MYANTMWESFFQKESYYLASISDLLCKFTEQVIFLTTNESNQFNTLRQKSITFFLFIASSEGQV